MGLNSRQSDNLRILTHSIENTGFGTLQSFRADIDDSPVKERAIFFRRERQNLHLWIATQQECAARTIFVSIIHGYD